MAYFIVVRGEGVSVNESGGGVEGRVNRERKRSIVVSVGVRLCEVVIQAKKLARVKLRKRVALRAVVGTHGFRRGLGLFRAYGAE
ncbi:MAG TPA: hypothetical protein VGG58_03575 [Candidatus Acidoferrum sp.]|jgi:hypothetical protein